MDPLKTSGTSFGNRINSVSATLLHFNYKHYMIVMHNTLNTHNHTSTVGKDQTHFVSTKRHLGTELAGQFDVPIYQLHFQLQNGS